MYSHLFWRGFMSYLYFFAFIYVYCCPIWFPYHMMLLLFNNNTTSAISRTGTSYPSRPPEFTLDFCKSLCCSIPRFPCIVLYIIVCYPLSFGHCFVCLSSIHGFWLPHWYIQTFHAIFPQKLSKLQMILKNNTLPYTCTY
jgi:hypothetical protein